MKKSNLVIQLPMEVHKGKCKGCKKIFQIGGGPLIGGYLIPTHHHVDIARAKKGENCPGSGEPPSELVPK